MSRGTKHCWFIKHCWLRYRFLSSCYQRHNFKSILKIVNIKSMNSFIIESPRIENASSANFLILSQLSINRIAALFHPTTIPLDERSISQHRPLKKWFPSVMPHQIFAVLSHFFAHFSALMHVSSREPLGQLVKGSALGWFVEDETWAHFSLSYFNRDEELKVYNWIG